MGLRCALWLLIGGCVFIPLDEPGEGRLDWPDHDFDGDGFTEEGADCDDENPLVYPGAEDACNDCNFTDRFDDPDGDGVPRCLDCDSTNPSLTEPYLFFVDADGDGEGDPTDAAEACDTELRFYVRSDLSPQEDCDDADPELNSNTQWFRDLDGDGYGVIDQQTRVCAPSQPEAWTRNPLDCDDTTAQVDLGCPWVHIAPADYMVCGVRASGAAECWGGNNWPATDDAVFRPPARRFIQVDVAERPNSGSRVACGVAAPEDEPTASNGEILCWGKRDDILDDLPSGQNFVHVSVGYKHACAIEDNGAVTCWGESLFSEPELAPSTGVVSLYAAPHRTAAVTADELLVWGTGEHPTPISPDPIADAVFPLEPGESYSKVQVNSWGVCVLTDHGRLQCAFNNEADRQATGVDAFTTTDGWSDFCFGEFRSCALDLDGALQCAGTVPGNYPAGQIFMGLACSAHGATDCAWSDASYMAGGERPSILQCWSRYPREESIPPADFDRDHHVIWPVID